MTMLEGERAHESLPAPNTPQDSIPTVSVIDDDASVRTALSRLLRSAGFQVKTYASAAEFLEDTEAERLGCLVLDVRMPGLGGMGLQEQLRRRAQSQPIIFLTGHGDIPTSVQAMKKGAVDFLTKPVKPELLLNAVRGAIAQHRRLREDIAATERIRRRVSTLTPRELEVMRCVIAGALNKQIAWHLGISEKTVKVHRARVMQKLEVISVADLVRVAEQAGVEPLLVKQ